MVTKRQQLEWMSKAHKEWPFILDFICMCNKFVGNVSYVVGSHRITKQEWQQERDKMSSKPKVDNSWHERGEFPPPVGCECEVVPKSGGAWAKAVILAVTNQNVIMLVNDEPLEVVSRASNVIFRPLRTERDKAIDEMYRAAYSVGNVINAETIGAIYDAGYRKVDDK